MSANRPQQELPLFDELLRGDELFPTQYDMLGSVFPIAHSQQGVLSQPSTSYRDGESDESQLLLPKQYDTGYQTPMNYPGNPKSGSIATLPGLGRISMQSSSKAVQVGPQDDQVDSEAAESESSEEDSFDSDDYVEENDNEGQQFGIMVNVPLFGANNVRVRLQVNSIQAGYIQTALRDLRLAVPDRSPQNMDLVVDAATTHLQQQNIFPSQAVIDGLRAQWNMEEVLECYEDHPIDFLAQPFMKRSLSYNLGERNTMSYMAGYGNIYLDACVITCPTRFNDNYTVTICDPYPGAPKVGTLFFYREPYFDFDVMTGKTTEREAWHPLVPQHGWDFSADIGDWVTHRYPLAPNSAPPAALVPPVSTLQPTTAPPAAPPARKRTLRSRGGPKVSHEDRNSASGRPYTHLTDHHILTGAIDPYLIAGELAIRMGINHEYDDIEAPIKARDPAYQKKKTKFFNHRVGAALKFKAKQLGITRAVMKQRYQTAQKAARQAVKNGQPLPALPPWVIS
ncbi:hypothetical protein Slin14017_G113250 [Septoria linicola]|nr:hypothetical protein Slin14017_G113250 [Septoria linicola]